MSGERIGALDGIRVIEIAGPITGYCGKLLADLGAEVVLVEPPAGNRSRREPPFIDDRADVESSLPFAYYNTSKKGVTLDISQPQGRELLLHLLPDFDLLLESEQPGSLEAKGLGYETLRSIKPPLVMTSITAFGQEGPYAQFAFSDLTLLALGGMLYLGGYPDMPPMSVSCNPALAAAGMYGAVASLVASYAVRNGQPGRHIDVSAQECVTLGMENAIQLYELEGAIRQRYAGTQRQAGTGVFPTQDGYILVMAAGIASNRFWASTVKWLLAEGVAGAERLNEARWSEIDYLNSEEAKTQFAAIFLPFAGAHTSDYLYHSGQKFRIPICPVCSPRDVVGNEQLNSRGYFVKVLHSATGREITMPGAPYRLQQTPWQIRRPPPRLGEHNGEIYGRAGIAPDRLAALAHAGVV